MRGDCKVQRVLGGSGFFQVVRSTENFLGVLGENLGLAGVVLLLDRRDKKIFLFFCYASRQTYIKVKRFTYSEGGTHEETLHPQVRLKVRTRDKGTGSQPNELRICKTDTVIA